MRYGVSSAEKCIGTIPHLGCRASIKPHVSLSRTFPQTRSTENVPSTATTTPASDRSNETTTLRHNGLDLVREENVRVVSLPVITAIEFFRR
jgi:hypothetical protein